MQFSQYCQGLVFFYAHFKNENVKPSSYTVKIDLFHVLSKLFE